MNKINFYAGPAILPAEVLRQAEESIRNFAGTGLSILEISHRSKQFVNVMQNARNLAKELMGLDENYEILFLQNGALSQFHMVPMNLLNENETAAYFDTGAWAHGAIEEARLFGNVQIACSSRDRNYSFIPANFDVNKDVKYLHVTSNNTIYGTQIDLTKIANKVSSAIPVVCDMSSDIFSKKIDYSRFALIYAGAQKNMGPAGTVMVAVNRNILGKVDRKIPKMLDYRQHIDRESMLNTPSVFSVYVCYLTLLWIKEQGIEKIEGNNNEKASLLYKAIDQSSLFEGTVASENRSKMNVCFRFSAEVKEAENAENAFIQFAEARNLIGLKGHRSVGGFRASIYNAMSLTGVNLLVDAMKEFELNFKG